jgi:hypothetical protein
VARADALFSRDAISPVNCATTCFVNSSAMPLFVQDGTMHAPFATEVEWNVRQFARSARKIGPVHPTLVCIVQSNSGLLRMSGQFRPIF